MWDPVTLKTAKMNYWVTKAKQPTAVIAGWVRKDKIFRWCTKRRPVELKAHDCLFIWKGGALSFVIAIAECLSVKKKPDMEGYYWFRIRFLTDAFEPKLTIGLLRKDPILKKASFLKVGPSGTLFRILPEMGRHLKLLACKRGLVEPGALPDGEIHASTADAVTNALERSAGFESNPRIRKAIEDYSMDLAAKYLDQEGFAPKDTHTTKPYDFVCRKGGAELFVEVKGTRAAGKAVLLTPAEVKHAKKHKNSALFIIHSVKVSGKKKPVVSGGEQRFLHPWDISAGILRPQSYVFTLQK